MNHALTTAVSRTYRDTNQKGNKVTKDVPKKLEISYLETVKQRKP